MTFLGFFAGISIMAVGFLTVTQTQWFLRNFGDLGLAFGAVGASWLSWKVFGLIAIFLGFFIAFGLFEAIFGGIIFRVFSLGQP